MGIKNPLVRWIAVVAIIMSISIAFHTLMDGRLHTHNLSGVYNIHYVNYRGRTAVDAGFEKHLRDHGVKFAITYHDLNFNAANAPTVREKINSDPDVDLIVTWGTTATLGIIGRFDAPEGGVIGRTPVVFTLVTSAERSGITGGKYVPRMNVTGASHIAPIYNQFRTMMAYHPSKKVGMIFTPTELNSVLTFQVMRSQAANHDVDVIGIGFTTNEEGRPDASNAIEALHKLKEQGVEWLYLPPDSFLGSKARDLIIPTAHKLGIRTFASTEQLMQAGAAYGLISPYALVGQHAAEQARKILVEKIKPDNIPVDTAPRFIHQVNMDALASLGLELPVERIGSIEIVSNENNR